MKIRIYYFRILLGLHLFTWLINMGVLGLGDASNQLQKGVLFATVLALFLTRKVDKTALCLIIGILLGTFISAMGTDYHAFSAGRYLSSLFSLAAVFLLLAGQPTEGDRNFLLNCFAWAPIACVAVGAFYDAIGIWPLWYQDFLGVVRLQGSTIPSGLGAICYAGVVASILASAYIKKKYLILSGINLIILALSAARMPFAASAMCVIVAFYYFHGRSFARVYMATGGLIFVCLAGYIAIGDKIMARFESESESGRDIIRDVLVSVLNQYSDFGIGLGHQITVIPEDVMIKTATFAAHNEYLRLTVETGYVGITIIMGLLLALFAYIFITRKNCQNPVYLTIVASFFVYSYTDNVISSNTSIFVLFMACSMSIAPQYRKSIARASNVNKNEFYPKSEYSTFGEKSATS